MLRDFGLVTVVRPGGGARRGDAGAAGGAGVGRGRAGAARARLRRRPPPSSAERRALAGAGDPETRGDPQRPPAPPSGVPARRPLLAASWASPSSASSPSPRSTASTPTRERCWAPRPVTRRAAGRVRRARTSEGRWTSTRTSPRTTARRPRTRARRTTGGRPRARSTPRARSGSATSSTGRSRSRSGSRTPSACVETQDAIYEPRRALPGRGELPVDRDPRRPRRGARTSSPSATGPCRWAGTATARSRTSTASASARRWGSPGPAASSRRS